MFEPDHDPFARPPVERITLDEVLAALPASLPPARILDLIAPLTIGSHPVPLAPGSGGDDASRALDLDLVRAVRHFAQLAWSSIVEPGDAVAGHLVVRFGPELSLLLASGIGPRLRARIGAAAVGSEPFGDPNELTRDAVDAALARWEPRLDLERIVREIENAASIGARIVTPDSPAWPSQLDDLGPHRPHALWLRGSRERLGDLAKSVAIIGSRASTPYGELITAECAAAAADAGLAVVSGGAYGIDRVAHASTLASGGSTIAILAGGVDRLYPSGNRELFGRIIERGVVAAEVPVGRAPERWRFLQRNRLIAALSQATLVVEAGARSGARSTAHHALQLGRGLGAVPGPITSAASVGCHELIDAGHARLVSRAEGVVELWRDAVGLEAQPELFDPSPHDSPFAIRVHDALGIRVWRTVAELALRSGCSVAEVRAALAELDLAGVAVESASGWKRA